LITDESRNFKLCAVVHVRCHIVQCTICNCSYDAF